MFLYKIFDDHEAPYTLFHGVEGSRKLPLNTWIYADVRPVTDGSRSTEYISGFHLLHSIADCLLYLRRFKKTDSKVIVAVEVDPAGIWPKKHASSKVYLSEKMRIYSKDWEERLFYKPRSPYDYISKDNCA